ncbi:hypothetical protein [Modestobacter sp. KNN46-3]|uniref:hypothetical protein n=1 Tax=Modestobacter sp. KNN46-3 TaxID=2711218 RepID=UPI0013DF097D|nr:hypothetical protein [Modestobacter sp. KNN46-3]
MIYLDLDDLLHETQIQRYDETIAAAIGQPALAPPTMVLLAPVDPRVARSVC